MCILDIIRFLARQGIAFRGHKEDSTSDNKGNFLELVHFIAKYHPPLNEWITTHPGNVSWLSPPIQNELLQMIAGECVEAIATNCRGRIVSLMCDEVRDRSNTELISVVVRYVSDDADVHESLLALIEVKETSGKFLFDKLADLMKTLHLSFDFVVGQCYDGASNMSGAYNGLQALVKQAGRYKPIYVHCWAHVLNLVLQDVAKSTALCSRTFDLLQRIYVVVEGLAKRHSEYLKACESMRLNDGLLALQSLSGTRWSAKAVNLRIVKRCMPAICACLAEMSDTEGDGLLNAIRDPTFVFGVEFLSRLFTLVNESSEALQSAECDMAAAANSIADLKADICRMNSAQEYDAIFDASAARCNELDIDVDKRHFGKRRKRVPAALSDCVMDRYLTSARDTLDAEDSADSMKRMLRVEYFRPVLDAISSSLSERFNADCCQVLQCLPAVFAKSLTEDGILRLANIFQLDGDVCFAEAKSMYANSEEYLTVDSLAQLGKTMQQNMHSKTKQNFYRLVVHLLTLPVTSASCERSHSKVALVKSAVRSSMTSQRLTDLVIVSSEKSVVDGLELSAVVDRFASFPRGLPL